MVEEFKCPYCNQTVNAFDARDEELLSLIEENPGINFTEQQRNTGWSTKTVAKHLASLLRKGLIKKTKIRQFPRTTIYHKVVSS